MPAAIREVYSYRADASVPAFPDDRPLIVFDGVCVLCSGFAKFVLRRDRRGRFRFATAQGPLGQALFRHYGLDAIDYETNLVLVDGRAFGKLDAFSVVMGELGLPWCLLCVVRVLPRRLSDWLYDRIATNRYRLFGRTESCMLPPPQWRERFLG
jgi:predicted DCC family thiol-disulfide oxidoreductase YuxK